MSERNRFTLCLGPDGKARIVGLEQPGASVLAQSLDYIAIRVPAHRFVNGPRGVGNKVHVPAQTTVYRIVARLGRRNFGFAGHGEGFEVEDMLVWDHARKASRK